MLLFFGGPQRPPGQPPQQPPAGGGAAPPAGGGAGLGNCGPGETLFIYATCSVSGLNQCDPWVEGLCFSGAPPATVPGPFGITLHLCGPASPGTTSGSVGIDPVYSAWLEASCDMSNCGGGAGQPPAAPAPPAPPAAPPPQLPAPPQQPQPCNCPQQGAEPVQLPPDDTAEIVSYSAPPAIDCSKWLGMRQGTEEWFANIDDIMAQFSAYGLWVLKNVMGVDLTGDCTQQ